MKNTFTTLCLLLMLPLHHLYASGTDENRFIWNEANAVMSTAKTKGDFNKAAQTYNKLIERGTVNSSILYNLGTALVLAGHYDQAVEALIRAERYSGTTWEIKRNLTLALAKGDNARIQPLPWYRYPLFWHYLLPMADRFLLAICANALLWLALTFRLSRFKATATTVALAALLFLILFGSSAATSIYKESIAGPIKIPENTQLDSRQIGGQSLP